jgi:hypothetical protein
MVDPSTWLRVNLEENRKVEMLKCLPAGRQVELSKRGLQSGWGRSNEEDERHKDEDGNQYRAGLPQLVCCEKLEQADISNYFDF